MKVSIIIPTYNESSSILDCINSLINQSYDDFEIIIVDDGSTDNTIKELQNMKTPELQVLKQNHLGAGQARNLGVKHAKGEILVFVDADMTFDQHFLRNLVNPILQGDTRGTFSKDEYVSNWDNYWARCWNINEGWDGKLRHPKNYPNHQPVFRAILKSEFDKVGGFTGGGYDDDWTLSKKLGYEANVSSNAVFFHKNPDNLKEIFHHAKWVGKRKYKFGWFGYMIGMVRSSLPISIIKSILMAIRFQLPAFVVFKIVYDAGIFVGILEYIITGKSSK